MDARPKMTTRCVALLLGLTLVACSSDDSTGAAGGSGAGGGAGGGDAGAGGAGGTTVDPATFASDPPCGQADDCCWVFDSCSVSGIVTHKSHQGEASAYLDDAYPMPGGECNACIGVAVQVSCEGGACVAHPLEDTPACDGARATPGIHSGHCGELNIVPECVSDDTVSSWSCMI